MFSILHNKEIDRLKSIQKIEEGRHKKTEKSLKGQLSKKDKILNKIIHTIIEKDLCKYFIDNPCKDYDGENGLTCDVCLRNHFIDICKQDNDIHPTYLGSNVTTKDGKHTGTIIDIEYTYLNRGKTQCTITLDTGNQLIKVDSEDIA